MPDGARVAPGLDSKDMPACLNCGGRLCKGETKCFTCEMPVTQEKSKREINLGRARTALTILFLFCLGLTIASLFTDFGPSFYKCAAATVILHFVRTSAVEMAAKDS
jgi:hypothetical protein